MICGISFLFRNLKTSVFLNLELYPGRHGFQAQDLQNILQSHAVCKFLANLVITILRNLISYHDCEIFVFFRNLTTVGFLDLKLYPGRYGFQTLTKYATVPCSVPMFSSFGPYKPQKSYLIYLDF